MGQHRFDGFEKGKGQGLSLAELSPAAERGSARWSDVQTYR